MFFSLSPEGHISMFIYHLPPACVPYLYTREAYTALTPIHPLHAVRHLNSRQAIHAKPTRRQAIHCAYAYTRAARHMPLLTPIAATPHHQSDLPKAHCYHLRPVRALHPG